jgi:alanine racemase
VLYRTHAVVHLQNIRKNIEAIRARVGAGRKILIAVKANGYGHGSVAVSRMAEKIGVDFLGVATIPEGIELREAQCALPILKFSPAFAGEEMRAAVTHNITLAVCDPENVRALQTIAQESARTLNVHIKVDTGMGRIGVSPDEAPALAQLIEQSCPNLRLEGIFTHLPVSDEARSVEFTQMQLSLFRATVAAMQAGLNNPAPIIHAANSGGILGHESSWFDMVRPGIMIYGFYPDTTTPQTVPLLPGLSFRTAISFIKRVKRGTPIGYGCSWVAPEDTFIATIPAGYADGFNRLFSNCGRVLINGASYPIVGRVCMDQSMVNLGSSTTVQVGDAVTLIGREGSQEITAYEWATRLGTITYEVTCQINARVQRHFDPFE